MAVGLLHLPNRIDPYIDAGTWLPHTNHVACPGHDLSTHPTHPTHKEGKPPYWCLSTVIFLIVILGCQMIVILGCQMIVILGCQMIAILGCQMTAAEEHELQSRGGVRGWDIVSCKDCKGALGCTIPTRREGKGIQEQVLALRV
ncbi:hypothetical protein K504DRAFT_463692, partial [Pleomassaria siparia CBS 279.74]